MTVHFSRWVHEALRLISMSMHGQSEGDLNACLIDAYGKDEASALIRRLCYRDEDD